MSHDGGRQNGPDTTSVVKRILPAAAMTIVLGVFSILSFQLTNGIDASAQSLGLKPKSERQRLAELAEAKAKEADAVAALKKIKDYDAARWHPIHFAPRIEKASDGECLACHAEVLKQDVRSASVAGVKADSVEAWYQTLDTYKGPQATFHQRHMSTPMAKELMNLSCNFCHKGNDPREEAAGSSATTTLSATGKHDLRKMVSTTDTCLLCHGAFPAQNMGLDGKWSELREGMESAEAPNGCLTCHADQFRTVRHQVSYLKADAIEAAAKAGSSDVCYGCHGGRQWYRISYPYPRHAWPGMDTSSVPDWAKNRPAQSDARYQLK